MVSKKTIIPLGMDFNFKITVGFYAMICMHQFEHNSSWSYPVAYDVPLQQRK